MPELPYEIWRDRIDNELNNLKKLTVVEQNSINMDTKSVELILNIQALGFIKDNTDLALKRSHRIYLKINRSFPYPGGIDFSWLSKIFHPNIHPVELSFSSELGTGYICLNILKKWSRLSDLANTVKALKMLIENPNPNDPLDFPQCLEAAKYYKIHKIEDLRKNYSSEKIFKDPEKKGNDDIKIIED